jgi:hypothetical protein
VPERNEVLGIERERGLENATGLIVAAGLEQGLAVHDVAAHVARLLRKKLLTNKDGLLEIPDFPVFVGEGREISARILVEFFAELVDTRRAGH